jgi:hypothetical protein
MIKTKTIFGILFLCTILFSSQTNATAINDSCQRIVLTMLTPNIQAQIKDYYSDILTVSPTFAPFLGPNSLEFKYFESHIDAAVTVIPYVGPHIDVGKDKMKFQIDNTGKIVTVNYEHIRDYKLPPNWSYIKR